MGSVCANALGQEYACQVRETARTHYCYIRVKKKDWWKVKSGRCPGTLLSNPYRPCIVVEGRDGVGFWRYFEGRVQEFAVDYRWDVKQRSSSKTTLSVFNLSNQRNGAAIDLYEDDYGRSRFGEKIKNSVWDMSSLTCPFIWRGWVDSWIYGSRVQGQDW